MENNIKEDLKKAMDSLGTKVEVSSKRSEGDEGNFEALTMPNSEPNQDEDSDVPEPRDKEKYPNDAEILNTLNSIHQNYIQHHRHDRAYAKFIAKIEGAINFLPRRGSDE